MASTLEQTPPRPTALDNTADAAESSSTSSSEPLLSELCPYCNINPPKYRCPACGARSCSLPCSKRHKVFNQCTGIRDPAAYVKRTDLNSLAALDRDYNYLAGVEKAVNRPPIIKYTTASEDKEIDHDGDADMNEDGEEKTGEDERSRRERLAKHLEGKGILVRQAPMGMKRARENKTALVGSKKKRKTIRWTVEWIILEKGQEKRVLTDKIHENKRLTEAYTEHLSSHITLPTNKHDRRRKIEASHFYLRKADAPANQPTLIEVAGDSSVCEALKGHVVLEYPTLLVADEVPTGYVIVEMENVKVEGKQQEDENAGGEEAEGQQDKVPVPVGVPGDVGGDNFVCEGSTPVATDTTSMQQVPVPALVSADEVVHVGGDLGGGEASATTTTDTDTNMIPKGEVGINIAGEDKDQVPVPLDPENGGAKQCPEGDGADKDPLQEVEEGNVHTSNMTGESSDAIVQPEDSTNP